MFRQFGVTRVDGLDELLEVSMAFARTQPAKIPAWAKANKQPGVCVYAISGGTGAHMADVLAGRRDQPGRQAEPFGGGGRGVRDVVAERTGQRQRPGHGPLTTAPLLNGGIDGGKATAAPHHPQPRAPEIPAPPA